MNPSPIRFGFIGAGQIAGYSAGAIQRHPQGQVVAAQDLNPDRLRELCEAYRIPKGYATATELFADPDVDAVYIAVPNKFHAALAIEALEAGKHVMLEKPFAMNLAEAQAVAATAARVGRVFTLGMNFRFNRSSQVTKALIERGDLGEIYHAKAFWFRRSGIPKLGTWFGHKALAGAGCLYDIGVHLLDLTLYLLDSFEPISVSGATYTKFGHLGLGGGSWGKSDREGLAFDVDDFATGLIRFANGSTVSLDVSWACHAEEKDRNDVQLYGTKAGALVNEGKLFRPDPETGEYYVLQEPNLPLRYPHTDRFHNFINHLLGTEELCVPVEQALAVQKILDALFESSLTGHEVELATFAGAQAA
jgi:predicted dehydrogenase